MDEFMRSSRSRCISLSLSLTLLSLLSLSILVAVEEALTIEESYDEKLGESKVLAEAEKKHIGTKVHKGHMVVIRINTAASGVFVQDVLRHSLDAMNLPREFTPSVIMDTGRSPKLESLFHQNVRERYFFDLRKKHKSHGLQMNKLDLTYEDLYDVPCILLLVQKGRLGDTFPSSLRAFDLRVKYASSSQLCQVSSFIQEFGRLCRYVPRNLDIAKLPFAMVCFLHVLVGTFATHATDFLSTV